MNESELQRMFNYVAYIKWQLPNLLKHMGCDINSLDGLQSELRTLMNSIDDELVSLAKHGV